MSHHDDLPSHYCQGCARPESTCVCPPDVCIRVWRFHDAPDHYTRLSPHGGDEDWLAFVPDGLRNHYIAWLQPGGPFGCCDVSTHPVYGGTVYIGAHS